MDTGFVAAAGAAEGRPGQTQGQADAQDGLFLNVCTAHGPD